jgi:hypothetical protein
MIDFDVLVNAPCHAAFGQTVTYYPGSGPMLSVQGVFTDKFVQTSFQDGAEIVSFRTVVNVRAALLPATPVQGELFRIQGVLYVVNTAEPDGMGDIRIYLGLASDREAHRIPLPPVC